PPATGAARRSWLERLADEKRTVVFFEAPHRMAKLQGELHEYLGDRPISVHREITKVNEELVVTPTNVPGRSLVARGEFTVVVHAVERDVSRPEEDGRLLDTVGQLIESSDLKAELLTTVVSRVLCISMPAAAK